MGNRFSAGTCKHCGNERPQRHTGRPGEYCDTKCRQAAFRDRRREARPDTSEFDERLHAELDLAEETIQRLRQALDTPEASLQEPLMIFRSLQHRVESMTAFVVGRTRLCGGTWDTIGSLLGMSMDTARKKYAAPVIKRYLQRSRGRVPAQRPASLTTARSGATSQSAIASSRSSVGADDTAGPGDTADHTEAPPGAAFAQDLASVLSSLQRASGLSLRAIGRRTGLSPSFLSRLMNGERFPRWEDTRKIARSCGADPDVLRRVWEDADARRSHAEPQTLNSALRYLHFRAGSPTPWKVSAMSNGTLTRETVIALLDGTHVTDWEDVQHLVAALDGEPTFFRPLWEA